MVDGWSVWKPFLPPLVTWSMQLRWTLAYGPHSTCFDLFAPSYSSLASHSAGAVAERAEKLKSEKYKDLPCDHMFMPIATETSGVFGPRTIQFLKDLGRRIRALTGEPKSTMTLFSGWLWQFREAMPSLSLEPTLSIMDSFYLFIFLTS
mgnify:CR=1 FL=1